MPTPSESSSSEPSGFFHDDDDEDDPFGVSHDEQPSRLSLSNGHDEHTGSSHPDNNDVRSDFSSVDNHGDQYRFSSDDDDNEASGSSHHDDDDKPSASTQVEIDKPSGSSRDDHHDYHHGIHPGAIFEPSSETEAFAKCVLALTSTENIEQLDSNDGEGGREDADEDEEKPDAAQNQERQEKQTRQTQMIEVFQNNEIECESTYAVQSTNFKCLNEAEDGMGQQQIISRKPVDDKLEEECRRDGNRLIMKPDYLHNTLAGIEDDVSASDQVPDGNEVFSLGHSSEAEDEMGQGQVFMGELVDENAEEERRREEERLHREAEYLRSELNGREGGRAGSGVPVQVAVEIGVSEQNYRLGTNQLKIAIGVLTTFLLSVVAILVFLLPNARSNTGRLPVVLTESPTTEIPLCQYTSYALFDREKVLLELLSNISDPALLLDVATPQGSAFAWLLDDDFTQNMCLYDTLKQRYGLAVFYISTNGDDWYTSEGWLSESTECEWTGIVCNGSKMVVELDLCK